MRYCVCLEISYLTSCCPDAGVGKSSILLRFCDDVFDEHQKATIGVDFKTRDMTMNDGTTVRATVWDTAGQEKFRALTASYYRGTHGIILVYDVTSRESLEHVETWLNEIDLYATEDEMVKLLVGNKIDKENREVTREEGQEFARSKNMVFIETSALTTDGVQQTFQEIVQKVLDNPVMNRATRPREKTGSNFSLEANGASDSEGGLGCGCW